MIIKLSSYYWGTKDTSVSFCEEAYKESKYIAEYYNTFTGSLYILVGIPFLNTKINNIALSSIFLGVGTILLHMTQRKYGQLLDESSMICLCYSILSNIRKTTYKEKYITPLLIFYFLNHENFMVFFLLFTILILLLTYESLNEREKKNKFYVNLFIYSMSSGTIFWVLDQKLCSLVQIYQLHAFWHITTSISIYCGLKILHG